jgi:amino acid adenylation domain-containing protein
MKDLTQRIAHLSPEKRKLLERMLAKQGAASPQAPVVPRPRGADVCPMSFSQQRLWILHQLDPDGALYNTAFSLRFRGPARGDRVERCYQELVRRHEILRTSFTFRDGQPVQVIVPPTVAFPPCREIDLGHLSPAEREARWEELALEEARRPFDLSSPPLLRVTWVRLADDDHVGLITLHHIVTDGWSHRVLLQELVVLYEAFTAGKPSPLPPLPVHYADFALWQRQRLQGQRLDDLLAYWKKQLAGVPPLELPTDAPRRANGSLAGASVPVLLPPALTEALRAVGQQEGATLFMTVLAAFQALLHRYSGQDDIAVGTPVANRPRKEVEGLIGFFVNTLVLRGDLSGDPTFREFLRRLRDAALGAYDHQEVPFEKLVEELRPEREATLNPLFQVMFALDREAVDALRRPDLTLEVRETDSGVARFDLLLYLEEGKRGLHGKLRYRTELFERATVDRLMGNFVSLLETIAEDPGRRLSEIGLLADDEARRVLVEFNATDADVPAGQTLPALLSQEAARQPGAVAVAGGRRTLTYGELEQWSDRIAGGLRALGVRRGDVVGVCAEHSPETVTALLGVLKAGGAFLPVDPGVPTERLRWMLRDAAPRLVLAPPAARGPLSAAGAQVIWLDELPAGAPADASQVGPRDAAYVIYTSGSTGRPKAVVVEHRGVVNLVHAQRRVFDVRPSDRVLQFAPLVFDASMSEVFVTLAAGATLVVAPAEEMRPGRELVELLRREAVSQVTLPPSVLAVLPPAAVPGLRTVVAAGEALPPDLAARWAAGRRLLNAYGPTENTVCATAGEYRVGERVTIGNPIDNVRVYVLDARMRPCPVGVPGELYLGGVGVARGYLGRPDLTAERFVADPFGPEPDGRLYRSGDRGRWLPSGELEFLGRIDEQVKVRGQRVEPGEVEATLREHPAVSAAVVIACDDTGSGKRLVAYVVPPLGGTAPAPEELREFARARLPEVLTPSTVVVLQDLPRTPSGKLDRRALPAPGRDSTGHRYVAPRTALERYLAELWQRELGVERVGAEDDFFELGGDSIRAAVLINCVQELFGEYVYTVALFDAPTVANLARYLGRNNPDAVRRLFGPESLPQDGAADAPLDRAAVDAFRGLVRVTPGRPGPRPAKNPPAVFVLSAPRSGSTLLRVLLGGSPALFAPPEMLLLHFRTLRQRLDTLDSDRHRFWLDGTVRALMQALGCGADEARASINTLAQEGCTVQEFYRQMQALLGGKILVDKTPWYALDPQTLGQAEECFAGAKFIHLLRHPAGMIASFEEAKLQAVLPPVLGPGAGAYSPRRLAELIWLVSQENILAFLSGIPAERQHRVRFEDLVRRPDEEMEKLADFLEVPFVAGMVQPYGDPRGRMTDAVDPAGRMLGDIKFHQHQVIDPAAADHWRDRLAVADLGAPTREQAAALGYVDAIANGNGHGNGKAAANGHGAAIRPLSRGEDAEEVLGRLSRGELTEEEVAVLLETTAAD